MTIGKREKDFFLPLFCVFYFLSSQCMQQRRGIAVADLGGNLAPAVSCVAEQQRAAQSQRFEIRIRGRSDGFGESSNECVLVHMAVLCNLCYGDGVTHTCVQKQQDFADDLVAQDRGFIGFCDELGQVKNRGAKKPSVWVVLRQFSDEKLTICAGERDRLKACECREGNFLRELYFENFVRENGREQLEIGVGVQNRLFLVRPRRKIGGVGNIVERPRGKFEMLLSVHVPADAAVNIIQPVYSLRRNRQPRLGYLTSSGTTHSAKHLFLPPGRF